MSALAPSLVEARGRAPRAVLLAIAIAWALAASAELTGTAETLHHDVLVEGRPLWAGVLLFLLAWQAMVAAMMLPSSLPLIRLFESVNARQPRAGAARAAFLGGYAAVWSGFGALAFGGDVAVHHTVGALPWLSERPWLVAAGVLAVAGGFQFTGLKDRCLTECRHPGPYLLSHYRRGAAGAFRLGAGHGLFCLGCCWALMLVMVLAGFGSLLWMAALAVLMAYEKLGRHGQAAVPAAGVALLLWAALVAAQPGWLPAWASGL